MYCSQVCGVCLHHKPEKDYQFQILFYFFMTLKSLRKYFQTAHETYLWAEFFISCALSKAAGFEVVVVVSVKEKSVLKRGKERVGS